MKLRSTYLFFLIVILLPLSVFGVVRWYETRYQRLPVLIGEAHRIGDFRLVNQQARRVERSGWDGKIVVANFFFTCCPVICPKMAFQLKRVQAYTQIPDLQIASFSVDPERDSVARLAEYAARMQIAGKNWDLLTGEKADIYRLARNSFRITATDGDGGADDFIHSEQLVLVDRQGRIRGYYKGTDETEVSQLIRDAQRLAREK